MAEFELNGKVVMMTGAGRGMGRAMSVGLAGAGAKVAMIDIDEDVLHEAAALVEGAGGQGAALAMVADGTSAEFDVMLMMAPLPRSIIWAPTALVQLTTPQTLRSTSHTISSRGFSSQVRG